MRIQKAVLLLVVLMSCAFVFGEEPQLDTKNAKALPADGGDPGKAYMQYFKAMDTGDLAALRKLVVAEDAKMMDSPEFKEAFPIMKSMHAREIKILSGKSDGKVAVLEATGKDPDGKTSKGTLMMLMEGKEWKVKNDAWATDMNQ